MYKAIHRNQMIFPGMHRGTVDRETQYFHIFHFVINRNVPITHGKRFSQWKKFLEKNNKTNARKKANNRF